MSEEFYPVFEMIRDKLYIPLISVPINEIINKGSALITILTINWIISYLIDEFKEYFFKVKK